MKFYLCCVASIYLFQRFAVFILQGLVLTINHHTS